LREHTGEFESVSPTTRAELTGAEFADDVLAFAPELPVLLVSGFCDPSITLPPTIAASLRKPGARRDSARRVERPRRKRPQAAELATVASAADGADPGAECDALTGTPQRGRQRAFFAFMTSVGSVRAAVRARERERVGRVAPGRGFEGEQRTDQCATCRLSALPLPGPRASRERARTPRRSTFARGQSEEGERPGMSEAWPRLRVSPAR